MTEEKKLIRDELKPMHETEAMAIAPELRERVDIFQIAAEILKEEGTQYTFCLTAGSTFHPEINSQKLGIPRVHMRHEQAATFAADAWGRITRRPGVAIIGTGTGLTNATSGVTQAYCSGAPMVVIQGDPGFYQDDRFTGGGQGGTHADQQYAGICKWVRRVGSTRSFIWQLKRAFRSTVTHPTGPCIVAHPRDLGGSAGQIVTRAEAYSYYKPGYWAPRVWKTQADPALLEQALRWLLEAEKPAMVVGHTLQQDDAEEELREFVHLLGIPCHARRSARGAISEYDPLNCGGRARGAVMRGSDRCLVLGLRIGSLEGEGRPPFWGANTRYIQAQPCVEHVELGLATEYELIGNVKMMLRQFIDCAKDMGIKGPPEKWNEWRQFVADTKADYEKRTLERTERMRGKTPLHPDLVGRLAWEFFRDEYQDDYIAVIDGFTASSYFTDWNKVIHSGMVMDSAETIGIGHGPGMAIGAGLATNREKPIFVLLGDGGIGAGGMDIETASRWNIPAIFFHENNNQMLGGVWRPTLSKAIKPTGNVMLDAWETLPNIRYDQMFKEFGCHPELVERDEQIKPALKRACDFAMKEKKPAFIEVFVDPDIIHEISVGIGGGFSRYVKWNDLPDFGQKLILENNLVRRSMLPTVDPTWREAILAYQKEKEG